MVRKLANLMIVLLAVMVISATALPAFADAVEKLVFSQNFEWPPTATDWVQTYEGTTLDGYYIADTSAGPYGNRVGGWFGPAGSQSIFLNNLPTHTALRLEYQVGFIGADWNNGRFTCSTGDLTLLDATFTNNFGGTQSYPTPGTYGGDGRYDATTMWGETTFVYNMSHTFADTRTNNWFVWSGPGADTSSANWDENEYWYIDNVKIYTISEVPEPGTLSALGSGLLGLAGFILRRRKQ